MNSRKAIKLLREMKGELDSFPVQGVGIPQGAPLYWLRKVHDYADQFFEKGSGPHIMLSALDLTIYSNIGSPTKQHMDAIVEAKSRLDHCIDFIQRFGLYRPPRKNMLESWNNGFILFLLGVLGSGAFLAGKYTTDMSAVELRRELRDLRDSLRTAEPAPPTIITIHDTVWVVDTAKTSAIVPAAPTLKAKK